MMANVSRVRMYRIVFLGAMLLFAARAALGAQELSLDELPGLRERAVVMRIISRIVEQDQEVVWDSENARVTIPGRPVGVKLVGANLIVMVQFTPFLRANGRNVLVAQGQIWINIPDEGMRYHTTMQTIPLEFGEQIYFFPLGSIEAKDEAYIEIQLVLEPYSGTPGDAGERGPGAAERQGRGPSDEARGPRGAGQQRRVPQSVDDDERQGSAPEDQPDQGSSLQEELP